MGVILSVEKMSLEEKIQAMETIWDDLCHHADSISSPSWHAKVLKDREDGIGVPSTLVGNVSGNNPFPITPLTESEAKQQIGALLKSSELTKESKYNPSVSAEIAKPIHLKNTDSELKKDSSEPSGYAQKLRELRKLKDEGLLTDKEYEQKRKAIVDGI
jgi:hypothetical protein